MILFSLEKDRMLVLHEIEEPLHLQFSSPQPCFIIEYFAPTCGEDWVPVKSHGLCASAENWTSAFKILFCEGVLMFRKVMHGTDQLCWNVLDLSTGCGLNLLVRCTESFGVLFL